IKTRHAWHLDVEKQNVRLMLRYCRECLSSVGALSDDLKVRRRFETDLDTSPRERFVIDNDCRDLHARATLDAEDDDSGVRPASDASSRGRAISTRSPG